MEEKKRDISLEEIEKDSLPYEVFKIFQEDLGSRVTMCLYYKSKYCPETCFYATERNRGRRPYWGPNNS